MSAEFRYTLEHPVTLTLKSSSGEREETIIEIVLKPLTKTKQLRVLDQAEGEVAKSIVLVASLAGQPVSVIDEIHPEDFQVLVEKAQGFPMPGQSTGTTSSAT